MQVAYWIPCALSVVTGTTMLTATQHGFAQAITMNDASVGAPVPRDALDGLETRKMKAMIRDIEFITKNSTLEYAGQALPDVTIVTEHELQLRSHAPETEAAAEEDGRALGRVSAFYDRQANRIFLDDPASIEGASLLHELVHFLQNINGKNETFDDHRICLEAEAYDIQSAWQTELKVDLAQKPDYGLVMTLYGACNDADFSWVESDHPENH